jgi:hypothetical protein
LAKLLSPYPGADIQHYIGAVVMCRRPLPDGPGSRGILGRLDQDHFCRPGVRREDDLIVFSQICHADDLSSGLEQWNIERFFHTRSLLWRLQPARIARLGMRSA